MFSTIELFAGAGGLDLGVEKAGFDTIGLIELDKDAADTLKRNRPNWNVINDDIANVSSLDLEEYFNLKKGLSGAQPENLCHFKVFTVKTLYTALHGCPDNRQYHKKGYKNCEIGAFYPDQR